MVGPDGYSCWYLVSVWDKKSPSSSGGFGKARVVKKSRSVGWRRGVLLGWFVVGDEIIGLVKDGVSNRVVKCEAQFVSFSRECPG